MKSAPPSSLRWVALSATLLLALWLRSRGLSFGLPAVYNPDEIAILSRALAFATGDLNPHNFLYPTFFFYVLFGWIGAYFLIARITGVVSSLAAFQNLFFTDPSSIYLAGRLLGVACGVLGVAAVWWLARRLFGERVALIAAAFLAIAPTAVLDAHYIKHDVPATLAAVLAMIAIARTWPLERSWTRRDLVLAGAACGLACSIHYYAVFLAAPLVIAVWLRTSGPDGPRRVAALALAGGAAAATFFALSPFLLVEPGTAWRDIVANRQIVVDRAGAGGNWLPSASAYARMLWSDAVGWPVLVLALWGAWVAQRLSGRLTLWLLAFPLLFLLFISNTVAASRYLNPVIPFVCIAAALGVSDLAVRAWPRRRQLGAVALALLAAVPGTLASHAVGAFFRQADTRTLTQRFIEENVPSGSTLLVQPYSVQLAQSREALVEALTARLGDAGRASTKFALRLRLDPWPAPAYRTLYLGEGGLDADKIYVSYGDFAGRHAAEVFGSLGVDYVVLKRYPIDDPATEPLRAALERQGRLAARFSPYRAGAADLGPLAAAPFLHNTDAPLASSLERPGPIMELWTVR